MPALLCYVVVLFGQAADNRVPGSKSGCSAIGARSLRLSKTRTRCPAKTVFPSTGTPDRSAHRQELDVTPPQQQELVKLKLRYDKLEQFAIDSAVGKLLGEDRGNKGAIERNIDEVVQGIEKDLADILVPHQVNRLQQISFRYSVLSKGTAAALQGSLGRTS